MSQSNLSTHSIPGRSHREQGADDSEVVHSPEYLSWRKLHLAKSKLANVAEMASFMAGFAVVGFFSIPYRTRNYVLEN